MGAVVAAIPYDIQEDAEKSYKFSSNTEEILSAGEEAIFVDTPESLEVHLEMMYPKDPDFPFITRIATQEVNQWERQRLTGGDSRVPAKIVNVLKNARVDASQKPSLDMLLEAAKKFKSLRIPHELAPKDDEMIKVFAAKCVYGIGRSWRKRDILKYSPRSATFRKNQKKKEEYISIQQTHPITFTHIGILVTKSFSFFMESSPELKGVINSPYGHDTTTAVKFLEYFTRIKKKKVFTGFLEKSQWKKLQTDAEHVATHELPKGVKVDEWVKRDIENYKTQAKQIVELCLSAKKKRAKPPAKV